MKKSIGDCTFKEFTSYCNDRACDGRWDLNTAIICTTVVESIYQIKPLFGRKKAREKKWEELKKIYFDTDKEIEI